MNFFKEKEDVLIEALRLKENGIPLQEIISRFPENQAKIQEFFETGDTVSNYLKSINLSEDALLSVLKNLPTEAEKPDLEKRGVTNNLSYRYNNIPSEAKGRFNLKEELSNLMLKKFLIPSVVVIIAIVGLVVFRNQSKIADKVAGDKSDIATPAKNGGGETGLPPQPAANPTAITDAIITLAINEQSEISSYDDETLLNSDSEEIAGLNTIYDETDFQ